MQIFRPKPRVLSGIFFLLAIQSLTPATAAAQTPASLVIQGGTLIDATGREPAQRVRDCRRGRRAGRVDEIQRAAHVRGAARRGSGGGTDRPGIAATGYGCRSACASG